MHVVGNRSIRKIGKTAPGELIRFSNDRIVSLGIVISKRDNEAFIAVLDDPYEGHPRLIFESNNHECLSYGTNWCLEPCEGAEAYPSRHELNRRPGVLALMGDHWFMSIATSDTDPMGRFNFEWVNLSEPAIATDTVRGAYFASWKIWLDGERLNSHREPLFQFEAKSTAPKA